MYVFSVKVDNRVRSKNDTFLIEELEIVTKGKETVVYPLK